MKPITWIPLIWGVICGAASSGEYTWTLESVLKVLTCMLLSGPLMTGYTQTLNDFYDREIDAINEPYRPIPSGAISIPQVTAQILILLGGGLGVAYLLDLWAKHAVAPSGNSLSSAVYRLLPNDSDLSVALAAVLLAMLASRA
jgi:chlorophyll synthase